METLPLANGERCAQSFSSESASICTTRAVVGVDSVLDRIDDRVTERGGFVVSTQSASSQPRIVLAKRKFEDLDVGVAESSGSVVVRPRRELRDDNAQETITSRSSGRQTTALGEQFNNHDYDSRIIEEIGGVAKNVNVFLEEDSNVDKSLFQVPCEVDVDKLQPETEDTRTNADVEVQKTTIIDFCKSQSSVSKEEIKESTIDEEQGDMEWSSPDTQAVDNASGFMICPSSTSAREIAAESDATVLDAGDNVLHMSENEEDKVHFTATGENGYNGNCLDMLQKEKEEEFINSFSKCFTEALEVVLAADPCIEMSGSSKGKGGSLLNEASSSVPLVSAVDRDVNASKITLQFFVRTILDGTVVLHANLSDTVESVHRQIQLRTGLPSCEQRLIYCGKQLQRDQPLAAYNVTSDATLNLVGRMRSTALPHSWQLVNDLVATIRLMFVVGDTQKDLQDRVRFQVKDFLKMAAKSVPSSEHMQVFQLAGATSALVMLMLSPVEGNRKCAEESIKLFSSSNEEYLPNHIHCYCAPVLLEFCKLIAKSAPSHNLYAVCRNSLASLLVTVGVAHGNSYFNDAKPSTIVQEFSPFINELSISLLSNLRACALKDTAVNILQQYVKEGHDFTAFVVPLCKAMEVCKGIEAHALVDMEKRGMGAPQELCQSQLMTGNCFVSSNEEIGSHKWLHTVFSKLLQEIDSCLKALEDVLDAPATSAVEDHSFVWAPFIVVLKGLHAIAKLYEGAMEELLYKLQLRRLALNILIRQSRWHDDDHFWLLEHGFLLDFESKKRLLMAMLPEPQDDHDERQEVVVHRSQLLTESFEVLAYAEPEVLQGGISVEFITEEATGPGVLREWFTLVCREIFNPQNALFLSCPNDRRRFFPNPTSGVNPGHLTYFRFCGRVIALALMHRVQIDIVLARIFFMQLAGKSISWEDVQDADPCVYSSCKKILDMDAEFIDSDALALTFVTEVEELGSRKVVELCTGGRDLVVSSKNRHQYVELLIQRRFVTAVAEQVKCFAQGFSDLLVNSTHQQFLRALEPEDMDLMLYGKDRDICVDDWKAHTEYHDYVESDDHITWFWQVVDGMTMEQRRRLLFFSTSVTHLPAEGFAGLTSKFHIHRAHTDLSWLPTAHTCFYQLVLPPYPCFEVMYERLHAITEGHIAEGFGFA
eukprot:Gb_17176 [translate_table: standard]